MNLLTWNLCHKEVNKVDDILKHHGVKGMKWGVRKKSSQVKKDGKVKTRLKEEWRSAKREREWNKVLNDLHGMSIRDMQKVGSRISLENDLKRLAKGDIGTSKDRQNYRRREKMSNEELSRKVNLLRVKSNLYRNVRDASKGQRELGQKVATMAATIGVKYAITGKVDPKDILKTAKNPKQAKADMMQDFFNNQSKKKKKK
jgi:hypothetical protein